MALQSLGSRLSGCFFCLASAPDLQALAEPLPVAVKPLTVVKASVHTAGPPQGISLFSAQSSVFRVADYEHPATRRWGCLSGGFLRELSPQRICGNLLFRKSVALQGTQRPPPMPSVWLLFHKDDDPGSLRPATSQTSNERASPPHSPPTADEMRGKRVKRQIWGETAIHFSKQ